MKREMVKKLLEDASTSIDEKIEQIMKENGLYINSARSQSENDLNAKLTENNELKAWIESLSSEYETYKKQNGNYQSKKSVNFIKKDINNFNGEYYGAVSMFAKLLWHAKNKSILIKILL